MIQAYLQLLRLDKPTGTLLLGAPVALALLQASYALPAFPWYTALIFLMGVILTRSAGCIINDLWDKNIDPHVARTAQRPLARQAIQPWQALWLLAVIGIFLLILWLQLNTMARWIGVLAAGLTVIYPLCKRWFDWPQAVLGITFNLGVLMAYAQIQQALPAQSLWLYAASVCWTFAYDTLYGLSDHADDQLLGLHSSALTLGRYVHSGIAMSYGLSACALALAYSTPWPLSIICGVLIGFVYRCILSRYTAAQPLRSFHYNVLLGWGIVLLTGLQRIL